MEILETLQKVFHLTGVIVRWTLSFWVHLSSRNTAALKLLYGSPYLRTYCTLMSTVEWAGGAQWSLLAFPGQVEQFGEEY